MSLRAARICRICEQTSHLQNMLLISNERYAKQYVECANVEFDIDDELPKFLCDPCILNLNKAYQFKHQCEYAQKKFYSRLFGVSTIKLSKVTTSTKLPAELPNINDSSSNSTKKASTNIISNPENIPNSNETSVNDSTLSAASVPSEKCIVKNDNCLSLSNGGQLIILKKLKLKPKPKTYGQQTKALKLPPTHINEIKNLPNKNQCSICLRILHNKTALQKHFNWHINPKDDPMECKICKKMCSSNSILRRHIKTVHEKRDVSKSFGQKSEFSHHTDEEHISELQYYCTEKFITKHDVGHHKSIKHTDDVQNRKSLNNIKIKRDKSRIQTCSNKIKKKYYNKQKSRKYAQILREKEDEVLRLNLPNLCCQYCEQTLNSKDEHKVHENEHETNDKHRRYKCKVCGKLVAKFAIHNLKHTDI